MSLRIMKAVASKKIRKVFGRPDPEKIRHPLGLKLGRYVKVDTLPFLPARDELAVKIIGGRSRVVAVSNFEIQGNKVFRAYLENDTVLQIFGEDVDHPEDIRLFMSYDEVLPATESDWALWLNDEDGLIGMPEFYIEDDDENGFGYGSEWGSETSRSEPVTFAETIIDTDGSEAEFTHMGMMYGRGFETELPVQAEYCFVDLIEDSDDGADGAWVDISVAIPLEPRHIEVL